MTRVLVLDGFDDSRERTVKTLAQAGFSVVGVAEEEEAVAHVEEHEIDLVLLDLPADESIEGASAIRRGAVSKPAAILALLDPVDAAQRAHARDAGIDFVVLRPCPPNELVRHLRRFAR